MILKQKLYKASIDTFTDDALHLKPSFDLLFRYFCCAIPEDMIDVELTVRTVQCIHTSQKDHTTQSTTCSPLSRQMKPYPSLCRKIQAFVEQKTDENSPFPNCDQIHQKHCPHKKSQAEIPDGKQVEKTRHGTLCSL